MFADAATEGGTRSPPEGAAGRARRIRQECCPTGRRVVAQIHEDFSNGLAFIDAIFERGDIRQGIGTRVEKMQHREEPGFLVQHWSS